MSPRPAEGLPGNGPSSEWLLGGASRFDAVQGAVVAAPGGRIAVRLDAAKHFNGDPPDDGVLLSGLSDDSAQRQPTTIGYFDYLNRFAAFEAALREQAGVFPASVAHDIHR
jgi:hypothetical protein